MFRLFKPTIPHTLRIEHPVSLHPKVLERIKSLDIPNASRVITKMFNDDPEPYDLDNHQALQLSSLGTSCGGLSSQESGSLAEIRLYRDVLSRRLYLLENELIYDRIMADERVAKKRMYKGWRIDFGYYLATNILLVLIATFCGIFRWSSIGPTTLIAGYVYVVVELLRWTKFIADVVEQSWMNIRRYELKKRSLSHIAMTIQAYPQQNGCVHVLEFAKMLMGIVLLPTSFVFMVACQFVPENHWWLVAGRWLSMAQMALLLALWVLSCKSPFIGWPRAVLCANLCIEWTDVYTAVVYLAWPGITSFDINRYMASLLLAVPLCLLFVADDDASNQCFTLLHLGLVHRIFVTDVQWNAILQFVWEWCDINMAMLLFGVVCFAAFMVWIFLFVMPPMRALDTALLSFAMQLVAFVMLWMCMFLGKTKDSQDVV
jgi:hypothetical protein